jgi:PPOX class probable F420-dependent enzyme
VELPAAAIERQLAIAPIARFATRGRDGAPRVVPVVFAWDGARAWSPIDGKPKRAGELARERDVVAEPRVALLLDRWDPDWRTLWWIRVDGDAEVVPLAAGGEAAERAARALRAKHPQYATTPLFSGEPRLLSIRARRLVSWCAGPDAVAAALE